VNVRLFAMLRERAGADALELELPDGATVADAVEALRAKPELEGLERMPLRVAVNREYAPDETRIEPGDELAAIPPVSGGQDAPRVSVRISSEPLDLGALAAAVSDPRAGAVVTFQGVTREVDLLRYEAYEEMAAERLGAIARECAERHGLLAAAVEHRVGEVPLSEPSVIVAVSAPHRPEAFAGARELIDRVKAEAPIWKQEVEGDAARWVEGTAP
jgi:molybdopterin synthase catalytic subunit